MGNAGLVSNTNLEIAVRQMNSIGNSINEDLNVAEQEVASLGADTNENMIADIKELCKTVEEKIDKRYRDAAEKAARMDLGKMTNTVRDTEANIIAFQGRIRQILADIRRVRSTGTPTIVDTASSASVRVGNTGELTNRTYKPYMERLKPPSFSGKVEDWPEFRSVWKDLLSDYPESVQIQHLVANVPEVDKRRIAGVRSMTEIWKRLEKVYGDTKLNILTVKQTLEGFVPKATENYKRVLEIFEAVEKAVTFKSLSLSLSLSLSSHYHLIT